MAKVTHPPQRLTKAQRTRPSLYLAGPFDDGKWRDSIIEAVNDLDVDVYDPRNGVWETPAATALANGVFRGMLSWQLDNSVDATVVVFRLPEGAQAQTAVLQLGFLAAKRGGAKRGSSVIVGNAGNAQPNDIVRAFVLGTNIFYMPALDDVIRGARYQLTRTDGG